MPKLLLTTISGILDASRIEAEEKGFRILYTLPPSHVIVDGDVDSALRLRTIESVSRILAENILESIEKRNIRLSLRNSLKQLTGGEKTYTVKAKIYGSCFSEKILKIITIREIIRVHDRTAIGKKGSLLRIILDCEKKFLLIAEQVNEEPLHIRKYYVAKHPSPLNPVIAASIPFIAGKAYRRIYDPFCGSGTIPIEFKHVRKIEALGSDINHIFVKSAVKNAKAAGVSIDFFIANVRKIPVAGNVDFIATDPPRGERLKALNMWRYLKPVFELGTRLDADICLITPYFKITNLIAERKGYKLFKKTSTFQGGNKVYIVFYTKEDSL